MANANPILKIPYHSHFNIPILFSDDAKTSYLTQIKAKFKKVFDYLNHCDEKHFSPAIKGNVLTRVKTIQNQLFLSLEQYLNGHPAEAYFHFKEMLERGRLKHEIASLKQYKVPKHSYLFRAQRHYEAIRSKNANRQGFINLKQIRDLFHPPFEKRRAVATNRFSISGYPCLYLSESILTSYSECFPDKSDSNYNFHCIGLQNVRPLYFINLSNTSFSNPENGFPGLGNSDEEHSKNISEILEHLGVYHLIMASHTKIKYKPAYKGEKFYFKAEYIIPQLLLQWLKQEGYAIDGIRYKSCTGTAKFPGKTEHYNYVLPVQSNLEKGFCPSLYASFRFTPVYSYLSTKPPKNIRKVLEKIAIELKAVDLQTL